MKPSAVLIHFQQTVDAYEHLKDLGLKYTYGDHEIDVLVDNIPYEILRGDYQDPDEQLCEHYGIDYNQVNCIEAMY